MIETEQERIEREVAERAYEDRQVQASLQRENDFYANVHFGPESKRLREAHMAEQLHDQHPDRFSDWESPARMRRELQRNREEDQR